MGHSKNILVAGGAGFIGTNLIKSLLDQDHHVICLDNFLTGHRSNLMHLEDNSRLSILEHDVIQPMDMQVDMIYNLACAGSPPAYQADPIHTLKTSIYGVENLAQLALKNHCPMFHASTSEIYGEPLNHPQQESDWGNVNTLGIRACYDEGKRAAEALLFDYKRSHGLDIRIARIFNTYGPNMQADDGRVISNFINQVLRSEPMSMYGQGEQTRSFCYVDDMVEAIQALMALASAPASPVNLGNPSEYSMLEIADTIASLLNCRPQLAFKPLPKDDPTRRCPDISLAQTLLDWSPSTDLIHGLSRTIAYFKNQL